jgi:hypothetical protein
MKTSMGEFCAQDCELAFRRFGGEMGPADSGGLPCGDRLAPGPGMAAEKRTAAPGPEIDAEDTLRHGRRIHNPKPVGRRRRAGNAIQRRHRPADQGRAGRRRSQIKDRFGPRSVSNNIGQASDQTMANLAIGKPWSKPSRCGRAHS